MRHKPSPPQTYPTTASPLVIEGDDGGVAVTSLARPEVVGGEVEGTVRLMIGESSPSPAKEEERMTLSVIGGEKKAAGAYQPNKLQSCEMKSIPYPPAGPFSRRLSFARSKTPSLKFFKAKPSVSLSPPKTPFRNNQPAAEPILQKQGELLVMRLS